MTKWLSFICRQHCCWDQSAYPPSSNEQFSGDGLCGISACKVYPLMTLPSLAVSFYLTFSPSPLPSPQVEREKAVIFCGTICSAVLRVSTQHIRPGSSPVHCSALSGLSSSSYNEAITRLVAIISKKRVQK
jgi:hypothetical protein